MPTATYIYLPAAPFFHTQSTGVFDGQSVEVWRIPIRLSATLDAQLQSFLRENEISRADRFRKADDRQRFVTGRGMLRYLLGQILDINPGEVELTEEQNRKPVLSSKNKTPVHFNVSHSGDWILIAIAAGPVGVDIEKIEPGFASQEIQSQFFSEIEREFADNPAEFYTVWTRKEALAKAFGQGIGEQLKSFPGMNGTHDIGALSPAFSIDWTVVSFRMNEHYLVSVASAADSSELRFVQLIP